MAKKKTHEKFIQEVYEIVGNEYTVLTKYKGSANYVQMKHTNEKCNHEYPVTPANFLSGNRCPICSVLVRIQKETKTHEEFAKEVYNLVKDDYKILSKYINAKTPVIIKHMVCNHEYPVTPDTFLSGSRCPICAVSVSAQKRTKTHEWFKQEVYNLVGDEYTILSDYLGTHDYIQMRHTECKHEYPVTPQSFLQGSRCPQCAITIIHQKQTKSHEKFISEVFELVGDEYEVMEKYIDSKTHIKIKHNICNNEYPVAPNKFLSGRRCPFCSGKMKKNTEIFKQEVFDLVRDEYSVDSEYMDAKTYVQMTHNICTYSYPVTPDDFLRGRRCPLCAGHIKKTTEQFEQEVYELVGEEYFVLGEYTNSQTHIQMKHNVCGNEFPMNPNGFLQGSRCPICTSLLKTHEQFVKEVFDLVGKEYEVLGEYESSITYLQMKHNTCGYEYPVMPNTFLKGCRCPKCAGNQKKTTEEFKQEVYNLVGDEYKVMSEYIRTDEYIQMKHVNGMCNYEYPVRPTQFLHGTRCPLCSESKGEYKIRKVYSENNIYHDKQFTFSDLKGINGGLLRFDVPVFKDKEKTQLWFLTEYDGEFHYVVIKMSKNESYEIAEERLKTQQIHDKLKDEYCLTHGIPLLRIPYWEKNNIEQIINNFIQELSTKQNSSILLPTLASK